MWRPVIYLLCPIALVAGTPLRQAEAASDFLRFTSDVRLVFGNFSTRSGGEFVSSDQF